MVRGRLEVPRGAEPVVVVVAQLDARGAAALRGGALPHLQRAHHPLLRAEQAHLTWGTPTPTF